MFSILSLVLSALNTTYSVPVLYRCIFPVISNNVFFSLAMAIDSCKIQNKSSNECVYFTHIKETITHKTRQPLTNPNNRINELSSSGFVSSVKWHSLRRSEAYLHSQFAFVVLS